MGRSVWAGLGSLVKICVAVSTILQHYDYTKPRPCVGLCYIMKLRGGPKPVYPKHPPEERTACVGMCHRDRVEGLTRRRWRQERKKKRKVCVGACHNKKKKQRKLEKKLKMKKNPVDKKED